MLYVFQDFELSEEEFSLSRQGKRLPLEPRALRVLLVLAENAGKLMDKKALLEAVWKDTFVEETTLIRAIALIRKRLEDDPRTPKYIETVPTRGYRFIARVQVHTAVPMAAAEAVQEPRPAEKTPGEIEEPRPQLPAIATRPAERGRRWLPATLLARGLLAGGLLAGCAAAVFAFLPRHRVPALRNSETVVLADFRNTTGDPVFDDALRQGILVQLEQSPVLRLASDAQMQKTRKLMGLQMAGALNAEQSRALCRRIGGAVVLDGSIARLGTAYVLGLRARQCATGEELAVEQVQIAKKEDTLGALTSMATSFRQRIGEAANTLQELDKPLAEATTSSMDALQAFSQGIRAFNAKGSAAAVPLFQHAVDIDPGFAWAHAWLGRMYADLGQETQAADSTRRAFALRDRTSDRERLAIDVSYDLLVTGNLEKARSSCDAWLQLYPRDVYPRAFLAAYVYPAYGQYEEAVEQSRQSIALDPDFVVGYRNAAINLIALNRPADAEAVLKQAAGRGVFLPSFVTNAYRIAFLRGDEAAMKHALSLSPSNPWLVYYESATLLQNGRLRQARTVQQEALRLARRGGRQEFEAEILATAATANLLYGFADEAARQAQAALQLAQGRNVSPQIALTLALSGHTRQAVQIAADLKQQFPEDTLIQRRWLPTIEAAVALSHNKPGQALELLETTRPFGAGLPLYPICLRGQILLSQARPVEAAAEFQRMLAHPGVLLNDNLRDFAQIELARAYAMAGRGDDARSSYRLLLERWSRADVDLPILHQVRTEADKL